MKPYIKEKVVSWGDSYEQDITDPADEILALAVVIIIDCVTESSSAAASSASNQ